MCIHVSAHTHGCVSQNIVPEEPYNINAWAIRYVVIMTGDQNWVLMEKVIVIHDFQVAN